MAKKNVRNIFKKTDSTVVINTSNSPEYKTSGTFNQIEANKDPELIPHCISSFCYLGLFVWLLLDKNYNLLLDRNSLVIVVTCYTIEFVKFACHSYLVSRISNQIKLKTNPIFWMSQFIFFTILAVGVAYFFSILFGAPLITKQEQTFVFSILITAVIITPTAIQLGSNILPLLLTDCLENEFASTIEVYERNNFRITILGAFIGAAVIPFDWETEWQRWPIPCSVGLIGGHLLANVYEIICWQFKSLKKYSFKKNKF
ncbi:GPI biosynthesis protein Pig-F [Cinara cedri]|uniref:GPI biosynthesis protein Pig-F n=1 Tax=Cinara cedri TaxID=506608 RepID=A0A5E4MIP4_9HEMI|nr:GPI biosynthesis protein Pig-F [Cinara cedri]